MSDQNKIGADPAHTVSAPDIPEHVDVVVKCSRPVYRRTGISFTRGKNILMAITQKQLAIIMADPVLSVSEAPAPSAVVPGRMDILDVGNGVAPEGAINNSANVPDGESSPGAVDGAGPSLPERIRLCVSQLDSANPDHFTQAGAPRVAAVSAALGEPVTGEQLKAALAAGSEE